MTEKPLQESFLAQLSEVEVTSVQPEAVVQIDPAFDTKVDSIELVGNANHLSSEHTENAFQKDSIADIGIAPLDSKAAPSEATNGESASKVQVPPRTSSQTPQTVTGNVKIQLMEISVDEFKSNVEYIQQQYPSLPRRLVCDAFSKANFDCRLALEILAKEQEKKDQTIVPPMVLAAAAAAAAATASANKQQQQQQHQQQHQHQQQTPKSSQPPPPTPPSTPAPSGTLQAPATTPKSSQPRTPLPRGGNRRSANSSASAAKDDPCYRRVASADKEAERVLRQKLKSNVRSRVFNHGVKIGHGRETAATLVQRRAADSSGDEDEAPAEVEAPARVVVPPPRLESSGDQDMEEAAAAPPKPKDDVVEDELPGSDPMRILRDSFPSLPEARLSETLEACGMDVDAAIGALSGRPVVGGAAAAAGGASEKKFFKSRGGRVQQAARQGYVRAELSTGAWMDARTASAAGKAAAAAAAAVKSPPAAVVSTSLRVFTVQPKRRIKVNLAQSH